MKQVFILLLTLSMILSCNNHASNNTAGKSDTIRTLALFVDTSKNLKFDVIYRIVRNVFAFKLKDSLTAEKTWIKDTIYFIPVLDTLKVNGVVKFDSLGKALLVPSWLARPPSTILVDAGTNIDSVIRNYKK